MPRPRRLALVERRVDPQVVEHLSELLEDAKQGRVVGLIAAAHYGGREHGYYGSGSLSQPGLGIQAVAHLAKKLLR